jgi:hypothetical protein
VLTSHWAKTLPRLCFSAIAPPGWPSVELRTVPHLSQQSAAAGEGGYCTHGRRPPPLPRDDPCSAENGHGSRPTNSVSVPGALPSSAPADRLAFCCRTLAFACSRDTACSARAAPLHPVTAQGLSCGGHMDQAGGHYSCTHRPFLARAFCTIERSCVLTKSWR